MTYRELFYKAKMLADNNKITLGEYEEMTKPLDREIEQEPVLDKIRAEIEQNAYPIVHGVNNHEKGMTLYGVLQIIDKYKAESEGEDGEID
jgi:hypothetical protein